MPTSDYRTGKHLWHNATLGLLGNAECPWSLWTQSGMKASPGDPSPYPPRIYSGTKYLGGLLRAAVPPIETYQVTPEVNTWPYFGDDPSLSGSHFTVARNRSWGRLMEQVKGEASQLGTTLAESKEAIHLIGTRLLTTYRSYKELRRGNFRRALKLLSVDPKRKHRSWRRTSGKEASGLWLEYWFGWSPMCQDIFDSFVTIGTPNPHGWYNCVGASTVRLADKVRYVGSFGAARRHTVSGAKATFAQGAQFRVINDNAFLANRLGLINPAAIAWELVPFSFVVDWFAKVGNAIEGITDLYGTEHRLPWSTRYLRGTLLGEYGYAYNSVTGNIIRVQWRGHNVQRRLNLAYPIPQLPRVANFGNSLPRAATAASLMAQILVSD